VRKEEEEVAAAEKQLQGKSEGEKGFTLKYASTNRRGHGQQRGTQSGNGNPLAHDIEKLPCDTHVRRSARGQISLRSITRMGHDGVQLTRHCQR
jgi:hypothetical protein